MNSGNTCHTIIHRKLAKSWRKEFGLMLLAAILYLLSPVKTLAQTAEFVFQPAGGNYCAPAQVRFIPTFSETPLAYYWQTGISDDEAQEFSPTIIYTVPGTYHITLNVLYSNKLLEITHTITVYGPPVLTIKPDRNSICQPGDVTFTLTPGSGLAGASWNFGDGTAAVLTNGGQPVTHPYTDFGTYPVSVSAVDTRGCTGNAGIMFEIGRPTAELVDSPINGCLPAEVLFRAKVNVPDGSTVTGYLWDFNDGSAKVSNTTNEIRHTYNISDSIFPAVSIITSDGCTNTFQFNPLSFGMQPDVPKLAVNKPVGCASEKMYFTASGSSANKFYWTVDNGSLFSSALEMPTKDSVLEYEFEALGDFMVRVVAEKNGCRSEVSDSVNVTINGVVADFGFSNLCIAKNRFNFRNTSEGNVSRIRWTFIDSSNTSGQARPVFIFPKQGNFPVTMIVTDNISGCSDTASKTIFTALPELNPADTFVCLGNTLEMGVSNSYNSTRTTYMWTVGGRGNPPSTNSSFSMTVTTPGIFTNRVIINNGTGYCRDTLIQSIPLKVSGPSADFRSPGQVCQSEKLMVFDSSSTAFQANPVVAWKWDFGNGVTSADRNPQPVRFASPGYYNVALTIQDIDGCTSTATRKLKVNRLPLLRIIPRSQKVCQGEEITLYALHKSPVTWSSTAPIDCDTCSAIRLNPMDPTKVMLTSMDGYGCISKDSIFMDIWRSFELPAGVLRDTSICIGSSVQFDLKITGKLINWIQEPGLSAYDIANPVAKPLLTTRYTAVVTDTGRCFTRTASALVEVNPIPEVDPGPDLILPYNTPFTIKPVYSTAISRYNWQPASLLSCTNCAEPSGIATTSALFTVNVVSDKGCKSSAKIRLTLDCSDKNLLMPTAFTPNNDGLNDYFYPLTRGINKVRRFVIYNRLGELVFEKRDFKPNDRSFGWNGIYKGNLQPSGSFIYFVEAECDLGNVLNTKGNVVLMR